jgi:hypothetical protein
MPTIKNHPKSIQQVSLLRPSSQQHAANTNQRHHFTMPTQPKTLYAKQNNYWIIWQRKKTLSSPTTKVT